MRRTATVESLRGLARAAAATIALACVLAALPALSEESVPGPVPAEVLKVIDGDTLTVKARIWLGQDVRTNVRVAGIDAPELRSKCPRERELAKAARARLEQAVGGGHVTLSDVTFDKYGGRVLATVRTGAGENVASLMLEAGLAHAYHGGKRQPWCAESQAKR